MSLLDHSSGAGDIQDPKIPGPGLPVRAYKACATEDRAGGSAPGILEAAFGAGAPYYLSLFYQRRELGLRVSILIQMSPLANCFAASLAYGIAQINASLEPWRLIPLLGEFEG